MDFIEKKIKGVFEIVPSPIEDHRGFFMRVYDKKDFADRGLERDWVQENHSRSLEKGTIRGLHFQLPPFSETKLVRCVRGAVLDVFVDLRKKSDTFGHWDAVELSEINKKMIFIPKGFAHGYCSLDQGSEVIYKVDSIYSPQHEVGLLWNDPDLKIEWSVKNPVLSEKDQRNFTFKEFISKYKWIGNGNANNTNSVDVR